MGNDVQPFFFIFLLVFKCWNSLGTHHVREVGVRYDTFSAEIVDCRIMRPR